MRRALTIILACSLTGCSGLKLTAPLRHQPPAIIMQGLAPSRNNDVTNVPVPPLSPEWDQDVTAGIGGGAPCLVDSLLITGNMRGELYVLNATNGRRLGWVTLGGAIEGSPVINGNLAIVPVCGSRESVVAYDLLEAKVRWRWSGGDIHVSPLLIGQHLYVANTAGTVTCLTLAGGIKVWSYALPGNTTLKGIRSSPAGTDSCIVFGADDGSLYCCGALTGALRWRLHVGGPIQATPVIHDGHVFVGTLRGEFVAVRLADGTRTWDAQPGAQIYGAAIVDPTHVIVGTTGGHIVALDPVSGRTLWDTDLRSPVDCGLLGAGDLVYAGTLKKELLALKRATGEVIWRTMTDGRIKTAPVAGLGRVFVAQDSPLIQSFRGAR